VHAYERLYPQCDSGDSRALSLVPPPNSEFYGQYSPLRLIP